MALNRCGYQLELHDCRSIDASSVASTIWTFDGTTEDPQCDIGFEAFTKDNKMFTWNVSATVESMDERFAAAVMFQPKIKYDATGWLKADFSNNLFHTNGTITSQESEDDYITIETYLPIIVRTGILFRPRTDFEVELEWGI